MKVFQNKAPDHLQISRPPDYRYNGFQNGVEGVHPRRQKHWFSKKKKKMLKSIAYTNVCVRFLQFLPRPGVSGFCISETFRRPNKTKSAVFWCKWWHVNDDTYALPAGRQIFRMVAFLNLRICADSAVFADWYRADALCMIFSFSDFCKIANFWIVLFRGMKTDCSRTWSGNRKLFWIRISEKLWNLGEFENKSQAASVPCPTATFLVPPLLSGSEWPGEWHV